MSKFRNSQIPIQLMDRVRLIDVIVVHTLKTLTLMGNNLGCTNLVEFEIRTNSPPKNQRYYPISPILQKNIDDELNKMIELGVVEKSNSFIDFISERKRAEVTDFAWTTEY